MDQVVTQSGDPLSKENFDKTWTELIQSGAIDEVYENPEENRAKMVILERSRCLSDDKMLARRHRNSIEKKYYIRDQDACLDKLRPYFVGSKHSSWGSSMLDIDYYREMRERWTKVYKKALFYDTYNKGILEIIKRSVTRANLRDTVLNYIIPLLLFIKKDVEFVDVPDNVLEMEIQDLSSFTPEKMSYLNQLIQAFLVNRKRHGEGGGGGESRGQSRPRSSSSSVAGGGPMPLPLSAFYSPEALSIMEIIRKADSETKAAFSGEVAAKNKILKDLLMGELVKRNYIAYKKVYADGLELNAYKILNERMVGELFKIFFFKNLGEHDRLALQNNDLKLFWNLYLERMYRKWAGGAGMMIFNNPERGENCPSFYNLVGGGRITELFCLDKTKGRPFHYVLPLPQFIKNGVILLDLQNFGPGMSVQNPTVNVHTETFINFQDRVLNSLFYGQGYFS